MDKKQGVKKKNKKAGGKFKIVVNNFKYDRIIAKYAKKYGVAPDLVKSVVSIESSFRPNVISSKDCKGLMQLSKAAVITIWGKKKAETKWKKIFDPETNIETGTRYLKKWLTYYDGNVNKALVDYNWGHGNFSKFLKKHNNNLDHNLEALPKETKDFLTKYNKEAKEAFKKQKSGAFGECIWITIFGIHICIRAVAP